jgi:ATP-dependent RNA helicase RhlE
MRGLDIIGASKSGTGKTASYVLPVLNKLQKVVKAENKVVRALVIVPTIELCDQVTRTFMEFGKYVDIRVAKVQGGTPKSIQLERLKKGTDVVVATPGRLQDFIRDNKIHLENVNTIILDEADTMLELGFRDEIKTILGKCAKPRQIMMFSATISQNIKRLGKEFLREPAIVEVSNRRDLVNVIAHRAYKIDKKRKEELVVQLIKDLGIKQMLLFVNTKTAANSVFEYLKNNNIRVAIIHGDRTRGERAKALSLLKSEKTQVLVATDIAARGVDIAELPFVMNFDIPEKTDDYTHRVGRTGRANHKGAVISLLTIHDYNAFSQIEKDLRMNVKRDVYEGFELTDKQPRQKRPVKKSLREKKGYIDYDKKRKFTYAAQKKKRDAKRADRERRKGNEKKK